MNGRWFWRARRGRALCAGLVAGAVMATFTPGANAAEPGGTGVPAASSAASAAAGKGTVTGPVRASAFKGDVRNLPPATPGKGVEEGLDPPGYTAPPAPPPSANPRRGSQIAGTDGATTAGTDAVTPPQFTNANPNFEGLACGGCPPDPTGDVGPDHYVQMINVQFRIWDKQGNPLTNAANINQLWATANAGGQCSIQNVGDPIVVYDQLADRWLLSQFFRNGMCIAISQTADPTAAYHLYEFPTGNFPDYPKFGVWPDGYYMTTHEGEHGVYVFDRANMLNGNPALMIRQAIANVGGGRGARLLPSDWDGAKPPPSGAPNHLARSLDGEINGGTDRIELYEAVTDWQVNPPTLAVNGPLNLNTAPFDTDFSDCVNRNCVPQPGTTQEIDNLTQRMMWRLQYRNFGSHEAMVVNQTVDFDGTDRSSIRWYELRKSGGGNWSIFQQGTYSPNAVNRFMGSMAMDGAGNIAVGYTATFDAPDAANDVFNSIWYTGRLAGDPLGLLPATESTLVTGTTSQTGSARWGDYTQMGVDPVDDCTFWYTGEYNGGQTRIGSFKFPGCDPVDLRIIKSDSPDPVNAGEQLTYSISVTNNGPNTAQNVVVTDVLPAGVQFLNSAPTCTNAAGTLTCPLGTILTGQTVQLVIQVKVPANFLAGSSTKTITNTASVAAVGQTDSNPANNTANAITTVKDLADVAVTKVCKPDGPAPAGTEAYCDIHVDNLGPSDARDVVLTDVLTSASPFSVVSVTVTPAASGTCNPTTSGPVTSFTTTCSLGIEPAAGRSTVRVTVTAADVAQVNDVATVRSATGDPDTTNNQAKGTVTFTGLADLSLAKSGAPTVVAGTEMTYLITVRNDGPSSATAVKVADTLPLGVSFVTVTPSQGSCTSGQPGARDLVCGLGNLAAAAQATVTVRVFVAPDVAAGTILFNQAVVSSATADPDNDDVRASVSTTVSASANLGVTKTDSPDPVIAGNNLTYTITVTNAGPSTAQSVVISDTLPTGASYVGGEDGNGAKVCTLVQPDRVDCALSSIAPGTSKTVYLTVKVAPSVAHGATLNNSVIVSSTTPDPVAANNTAGAATSVTTSAELWLDKTGIRRSGNPSPVVVYTLAVHNNNGCESDAQSTPTPTCGAGGPSDAQNVVVTDKLPLDPKKVVVQFVSPQCTYTAANHTVVCTSSTVPAGAVVEFVIEVQVSGSVGTISNTATLTSTTTDPVSANNTDEVSIVMKGGTGKN